MVKTGNFFSIFAVLTLLILLAPAVILAPGGNVAANAEDVVQEVTGPFTFNETAPGAWNTFTAGSGGIQPPGLCLEQYTRDNVVRNTTLAACGFRNYTTGSGNVGGGGLDGTLSLAWLTFNFNMKYPNATLYHDYGTGAHFGWMAGRGHFYTGGSPNNNFTFVYILDFDSNNATMSNAVGKGFLTSVEENGTFAGHKIIGDFNITKSGASYTGTYNLRIYPPNEVYDLGLLNVTGGVLGEWKDPIATPLALLDYMSDGPYPTPLNKTTDFEEIAWGRDPIKTVTTGHLGVNGTMDLSRNTALYQEVMTTSVRIQGTTACNLYINDTDTGVRAGDGSSYGDLYELLLLYIPDQQLPLGEFFYQQNGYTFTPFGMLNPSTECYAGTEYYAFAGVAIESTLGTVAQQWSVYHSYGLYPHPKVASVTPGGGMPGATINVTIKGKYFLRAAGQKSGWVPNSGSVNFGPGITVNSYSIKNSSPIDNEITASITIAGDAATGSRDVNVTSCFGYSNSTGTAPYLSGHGAFNVTGPPTQEEIFGAKLTRLTANATSMPIPVNDVIDSLNKTVSKSFNCSGGSSVTKVMVNIATTVKDWDPKEAEKVKNETGETPVGIYGWDASWQVVGGVKTINATNWVMLDPNVTIPEENNPPLGPLADEGLLYHELLHGQLLINAMNTSAWQAEACNCTFNLTPADASHVVIYPAVNSYLTNRAPTMNVRVIEPTAKQADKDGNFTIDLGPTDKTEWSYYILEPSGGSNVQDINVTVVDGKINVTGKLIDKTKPGKFYIRIDPSDEWIIGGLENAIVVLPPSAAVGERNLPADALNVDAEYPGDTFDVYVNFTALADDFAGIGLTDLAPAGWDVATDVSWCDPEASWTMSPGNKVEYAWSGPFSEGQNFTARYKVTIPATASPGINEWPNCEIDKAWLEYWFGAEGPFKSCVRGDWQKIVTVPGCVVGETRDVNADLLTTTLVVLHEQPPEIGDEPEDSDSSTAPDAIYRDDVDDTGQYWLQASKYCYFPLDTNAMPGTRNPWHDDYINFTDTTLLAAGYNLDFEGDYGLVPKACNMSYAMKSVNHWLFVPTDALAVPHPEWQLSNWKAMESVHSWQFPCGCNA